MTLIRLVVHAVALALVVLAWEHWFGLSSATPRALAALVLIPYLFLLVSHSPREIAGAFRDAWREDHTTTPVERLEAGASAFGALGRYTLAMGVMATFWTLLAGMNYMARLGATVTPQDYAPFVSEGFLLPALAVVFRWLLYGPLSDRLRAAWQLSDD